MSTVNPELRNQLVEVFKAAWHHADEHGDGEGTRTEAGIDAVLASASIAVVDEPSEPEQRLNKLRDEISNAVDFKHAHGVDGYNASADAMWKAAPSLRSTTQPPRSEPLASRRAGPHSPSTATP